MRWQRELLQWVRGSSILDREIDREMDRYEFNPYLCGCAMSATTEGQQTSLGAIRWQRNLL